MCICVNAGRPVDSGDSAKKIRSPEAGGPPAGGGGAPRDDGHLAALAPEADGPALGPADRRLGWTRNPRGIDVELGIDVWFFKETYILNFA